LWHYGEEEVSDGDWISKGGWAMRREVVREGRKGEIGQA